jgi:hypothetical protein
MNDDNRRRELELDRECAKQNLEDQDDDGQAGRISQISIATVPCPGDSGHDNYDNADQRSGPAMADLDHGGKIKRREPLTVTPRPVVSTAHSGAGDPNDPAEHNEPECQARPQPCEAAQKSKLVWWRCFHSSRKLIASS